MARMFLRCLLLSCIAFPLHAAPPNVLTILVDDLGFSDLGCYGSEIATPNLDALAGQGVRFTQFYNTAKCHSSRVSLLSGRWSHQAGDESLSRAAIIPEMLGKAGYFTAMTGKWHLTKQPTDFGFDRYFGHLSGSTNYYKGDGTFRLNGEPWKVPPKDFYTTVADVDFALKFLGEARETRRPWFLYVAFNAPHAPLQPLEEDYKRYLGKYDVGWDAIRKARVEKQKKLGLFGKEVDAGSRPAHVAAWESLSAEVRDWESRRMAAYAALIDRVDREVGRLVADLKAKGEFENTLILFFSDNGACPYDRGNKGKDQPPYLATTSWSDSTGWAWARNSPFRFYKQNQFEGGIATPAVMHWPAGIKLPPGALVHSPAHLVDVLPTVAAVTGADVPTSWPGRELTPLAGVSLAPILKGETVTSRPPIHLLFGSDRGLRDGDWKLVSFQSQPWELYNLANDRTELHDLASKEASRVKRMAEQWTAMSKDVLMAPAREFSPVSPEADEKRHREWTDFSGNGAPAEPRKKKKGGKPAADANAEPEQIRARTGTVFATENDQLVLTCTGNDPGLSFDSLPGITVPGPYRLVFEVQSKAGGGGEIYWTTDPQTKLPAGRRQAFPVKHDGEWHKVSLELDTPEKLHALRLDPCAAPGVVRIKHLQLQKTAGEILQSWPKVAR